jgi:hypothetical protein
MRILSGFTAQVLVCPLLALTAYFATATCSSFAQATRPAILEPEATAGLYGSACAADMLSGNQCTSSLMNHCSPNGGVACTKNATCAASGTICAENGGANMNTVLCDKASNNQKCSATCHGGCMNYYWGMNLGNCSSVCIQSNECGFPICTVTINSI